MFQTLTFQILKFRISRDINGSFQGELLNYGKGAVTFIRGALIGARARAWLELKRLRQMHPKTFTTGNSLLSHLIPLSQCNVRCVRLTRTRERERQKDGKKRRR